MTNGSVAVIHRQLAAAPFKGRRGLLTSSGCCPVAPLPEILLLFSVTSLVDRVSDN